MIRAIITGAVSSQITDFLGEDGTERTGTYEGYEIAFYDEHTEERVGSATYYLRPGSAIETKADIQTRVAEELEKFNNDPTYLKSIDDSAVVEVSSEVQSAVDKLTTDIGKSPDELK